MKYKIIILDEAWENLKRIEDYYFLNVNKKRALEITGDILNSIGRLEVFPELGSIHNDDWLLENNYRVLFHNDYAIIYKIFDYDIYIYTIVNTKTDYINLFKHAYIN